MAGNLKLNGDSRMIESAAGLSDAWGSDTAIAPWPTPVTCTYDERHVDVEKTDSRRRSGRHTGYACGTGALGERRWVGREERTLRLESTLWP